MSNNKQGGDRTGPLIYYDWITQLNKIPNKEDRWDILDAIIYYDEWGEKKEFDNPLLEVIAEKYYIEIDNQQQKWESAAKRPARYDMGMFVPLFAEGWTNQEIQEKIGCSLRTVQRKRIEWEKMCDE